MKFIFLSTHQIYLEFIFTLFALSISVSIISGKKESGNNLSKGNLINAWFFFIELACFIIIETVFFSKILNEKINYSKLKAKKFPT